MPWLITTSTFPSFWAVINFNAKRQAHEWLSNSNFVYEVINCLFKTLMKEIKPADIAQIGLSFNITVCQLQMIFFWFQTMRLFLISTQSIIVFNSSPQVKKKYSDSGWANQSCRYGEMSVYSKRWFKISRTFWSFQTIGNLIERK